MTPALSVLDLVPVRSGQSTADALAASTALARTADRLGFRRYWVAEHHNMPAVAATNPAVLVGLLAGATETVRVGSGGVMLPNHAPLVVAEQFALLEAAFPGRIDLGIGRAPGSDPVTSWALRAGGPVASGVASGAGGAGGDPVAQFPDHVRNVVLMLSPGGVGLEIGGRDYELRATPRAVTRPPVWLLGSSDYSAHLAAAMGLPYVFAHHFSGQGTAEALAAYRAEFRPDTRLGIDLAEPTTFLTVNACVAPTAEEAERLARPYLLAMVALRTGGPMRPQLSVQEAERTPLPPQHQGLYDAMRARWVVGDPASAAGLVEELAARFGVDEVMVHPVAGSEEDADPGRSESRERTLELLAAALPGGRSGPAAVG